jgi:monoterpene epsilon-lactone hydrolase
MGAQPGSPLRSQVKAAPALFQAASRALLRRLVKGPLRPRWNWTIELATEVLRSQLTTALAMPIQEARGFLDSVSASSSAVSRVQITSVSAGAVKGSWFVPRGPQAKLSGLYFHGGGYSFYPKGQADLIARITLATRSKLFALDYRLSPEHRFPAQLEDAVNAYVWLLNTGIKPNELFLAGDSAGGNLAIALLLVLRERNLPLPTVTAAISPPTDFSAADKPPVLGSTLITNEPFDWIQTHMLLKWANWFCDSRQRLNPLVSPIYADLRGLPPIYIQAGRAEILYDSIDTFASYAKQKGANVLLESWEDMNHNFQMFGSRVPQSVEALRRIGEVINSCARKYQSSGTF